MHDNRVKSAGVLGRLRWWVESVGGAQQLVCPS